MAEDLPKCLDTPSSPYLVYTSAGEHNRARSWVKGSKGFDLWITSYADTDLNLQGIADYYNERKGGKFPNVRHAHKTWPRIFERYEAVFVMDDDLQISTADISHLFKTLFEFQLDILQPAFSQFGKWSHHVTRAKLFSYLRYSNFIEVTCPMFRMESFVNFIFVYDPVLVGWGIDHWFMQHLVGSAKSKAAIVDAVIAVNPFDEVKGGREILRLQADVTRSALWRQIKKSRNISEVEPIRAWQTIRRWGSLHFYKGVMVTLWTKIWVRVRCIFGVDPSQRMVED